jgi:hypothetical protein
MSASNVFLYWFFGITLVLMVAVIVFIKIQARKRTQSLQAAAQDMGFIFEGEDWSDRTQAPQLDAVLFGKGSRQRFVNIMTGAVGGFKTSLFDYSFTVGGGKSSNTLTQTVAAFSQELWLPLFEMRREVFFDRIGDAFVHKDINFDSHPEFSERYLLRGAEQDKIRELFTPALLTFLQGLSPEDKWHIEGVGATLILYRSDVTVGAGEIRPFLDETSLARTFFGSCGLKKPLA